MALISTKGVYGLEVLFVLASQQRPLSLKELAVELDVSESYLEHIASALKRSGYIKSQRGAQGGYSLAWESDDIIVKEVLALLENDFVLVGPRNGMLDVFWSNAKEKFDTLFNTTLSELIAMRTNQSMYYI